MPLWNNSKKESETVTMDKAGSSCPAPSVSSPLDIKLAYEFKEVLGTYVSLVFLTGRVKIHGRYTVRDNSAISN